MKKPPTHLLKEAFNKLKDDSDEYVWQVARECLLFPAEIEMCFDHLRQIQKKRKRGAAKAAETRPQKRIQTNTADLNAEATSSSSTRQKQKANTADTETTLCGVCTEEYEETEEPEWISCGMFLGWLHFQCVHVDPGSIPDRFICERCTGIQ